MKYASYAVAASLLATSALVTPAYARQAADEAAVDELVVTGQRLSQRRAIETKREAVAVVDVISADDIGRLADKNVAENVERLPGVGVAYDQGEGRYVSIRGVSPALNNVTLNGVEIGNPDGIDRALPLDIVSSQTLSRIEVVKAVTPDMDAQGIGGTVNLVTQSPFDQAKARFAQGSAQIGYQEFNDKTPYQADATVGGTSEDGRVGVIVGGNYSYRDYRSDGIYPDDWRSVPNVARGGLPTNIKYTSYNLERERIGVSGALEYRPSDDDKVYLRGLYSRFTENEYRQRNRLDFATNAVLGRANGLVFNADRTTGVATGIEMRQDLRLEYKEKSVMSVSVGGEHVRGPWTATYDLSYGYDEVIEPNELWLFRGGSFTVDVDMGPLLYTATPRNPTPAPLVFNQYTVQDEYGEETNWAGKLDLKRDIDFGEDSFVKFGAKLRDTDKSFDGLTTVYGQGIPANRFNLSQFDLQGEPQVTELSGQTYTNPLTIDEDAIKAFTDANLNSSRFVLNTATTLSNATLNDYDLQERILAGYGMASLGFGQLRLIGGVRVERTETDVQGFRLENGATVVPVERSNEYTNLLPNLQLRFEPSDETVFRLAYTRTLGRPQYPQLKPGGSLSFEPIAGGLFQGSLSEGNTELKPYVSDNFDASAEWYFAPGGLVSAGAFYKKIDDPIFGFSETRNNVTIEGRTYATLSYSQPRNAEKGDIKGLELAYQQQFTFLPGLFSGFGLAANVTFTESSLTAPGRGKTPFPQQSDLLYGGQIFYQKGRLEAAISYHHNGHSLLSLGGNPEADVFTDDYDRVDAKATFALTDRISLFVDLQNLSDQVLRQYQFGRSDWLTNYERYKRTYYVGISARW